MTRYRHGGADASEFWWFPRNNENRVGGTRSHIGRVIGEGRGKPGNEGVDANSLEPIIAWCVPSCERLRRANTTSRSGASAERDVLMEQEVHTSGPTQLQPYQHSCVDLVGRAVGAGGRFVVQRLWREGGMGALWIAEDSTTGVRVAIKTIWSGRGSDTDRELFSREQVIQERLRGIPGVPTLLACGDVATGRGDSTPFLAMEWLRKGQTFRAWWARRRLKDRLEMMARVCDIVQRIHERNVLHCDIKPENIVVDQSGEVWLVDFGLAVPLKDEERAGSGWEIGWCRGTWRSMAPEQCEVECDAYHFTPALDVYSLGVTAAECLTGEIPYSRDPGATKDVDEARKIVHGGARCAAVSRQSIVHPGVRRVLHRSLATSAAERTGSAARLAAELRGLALRPVRWESMVAVGAVVVGLFAGWGAERGAYATGVEGRINGWTERAVAAVGKRGEAFDRVFLLTIDEASPAEKLREQLKLEAGWGYGEGEARRPMFARIVDALKERGASVVLPDAFFRQTELSSEATTGPLREAIERFEGADKQRRVVMAVRDWPAEAARPEIDPILDPAARAWGVSRVDEPKESSIVRIETALGLADGPTLPSSMLRAVAALECPACEPTFALREDPARIDVDFGSARVGMSVRLSECIRGTDMDEREESLTPQPYRRDDRFGLLMTRLPDRGVLAKGGMELSEFLSLGIDPARALIHERVVVVGFRLGENDVLDVPGGGRYYGCECKAAAVQAIADARMSAGTGPARPAPSGVVMAGWLGAAPCGVLAGRSAAARPADGRRLRYFLISGVAGMAVCGVGAWMMFRYWGVVWNPIAAMAAFGGALVAGAAAPWLYGAPSKEIRA